MGLFLSGPIGEFTRPIPIVVTLALLSSLVVAMCFNPTLCDTFIKKVKVDEHSEGGRFWKWARTAYRNLMAWSLKRGGIVMASAGALLVACVLLVVFRVIGLQLFPQLDSSKFYIDIKTPPGSTLEETAAAVKKIEAEFVFNLTETFRSPRLHPLYRPSGGFLTPGQWKGAMEAAGFVDIRFLPDIVRVQEEAPRFIAAAVGATRPL